MSTPPQERKSCWCCRAAARLAPTTSAPPRHCTRPTSLGATHVTTGNLTYFDSTRQKIGSEHVLASGSLPPRFPATVVDGEPYWDGGIVSNTPLGAVLDDLPSVHFIVFMIDLWRQDKRPTDVGAVVHHLVRSFLIFAALSGCDQPGWCVRP